MQSGIYCYLSSDQIYPEFENLKTKTDRLFVSFPKDENDILKLLPQDNTPNLLLFDPKMLSVASVETIKKISENPNYILALVSSEEENDENIKFFNLSSHIGHLIPYKGKIIESEINKLMMILGAAEQVNGMQMTVEKVMSSLENKKTIKLTSSSDRWKCYEEIGKYAEDLNVFSDFPNIVKTAASELITNAFYDAPKNPDTGSSLNPNRKTVVNLVPPNDVEFTFGTSGDYLWLFVKDPFGTLDKKTVIAALLRAATERTALTGDDGGAGLGLKMVYEWASELVFGLAKGESTLVGCKLKITRRNRDFDAELASLHICVKR
jgi:hypothetical protein